MARHFRDLETVTVPHVGESQMIASNTLMSSLGDGLPPVAFDDPRVIRIVRNFTEKVERPPGHHLALSWDHFGAVAYYFVPTELFTEGCMPSSDDRVTEPQTPSTTDG